MCLRLSFLHFLSFPRVVQMKDKDIKRLEEDKVGVFDLGRELQAAKEPNQHKVMI